MDYNNTSSKISNLYQTIHYTKRLPAEYAVIFVYNEDTLIEDEEHCSECISSIEKDMILNSFRKSAQCVYALNGEDIFIKTLPQIQNMHKYIFVYSMAQNITGVGRRSLIPLLCDYYKLNNIGSDFLSSTLGGNKELMYKLIAPYVSKNIPFTIYINKRTNVDAVVANLQYGIYILKPNDESASIGVEKIEFLGINIQFFISKLKSYQNQYSQFCIQEYIDGPEIELPLLFYEQEYYCPGCVEIVNSSPSGYLDYDTVKMDEYSFKEYSGSLVTEIIECSKTVAKVLNFETICRVDYRIKNNFPYIIDIGANPTISYHSSTNYIFRERFGDESSIYQMLLFSSILKKGLLEPPLNKTI